jgi:hypothetical protein
LRQEVEEVEVMEVEVMEVEVVALFPPTRIR